MIDLFVSDIHLAPADPATAARFIAFLHGPARNAARLFILGDLFEYWAGDDDLEDPFNARIVNALRTLSDDGVAVSFMAGNRDFLIGPGFARAAGLGLLPDPYSCDVGGMPTLLSHGDALCTDDADYQHFRARVRAPAWRDAFLSRPLADRKREIETLRATSEAEKQIKPMAIMDVNPRAIEALLRANDARVLIHGHTHRQGRHPLTVDGDACTRWVLGDWHAERSSVLACDAATCSFL